MNFFNNFSFRLPFAHPLIVLIFQIFDFFINFLEPLFIIGFIFNRFPLNLQRSDFFIKLVDVLRDWFAFQFSGRRRLINDINCFVRQKPVGYVPGG